MARERDYALTRILLRFLGNDAADERFIAMYALSIAVLRYPDSLVWTELLQFVCAVRGEAGDERSVAGIMIEGTAAP